MTPRAQWRTACEFGDSDNPESDIGSDPEASDGD